ncbi:MAG: hypothetical protein MJZ03_00990 [archaeon]|nr:hypothetical protein [archaeon]
MFTVNIVSDKNDGRIPVALTGQIMVDIQDLFRHVGEYIISREMRLQGVVSKKLSEKFTLYSDKLDGVTFESSSYRPETDGFGNILDDAIAMLETVMDTLGSGTGGYWVEDTFKDAIYRNQIIIDIVALYQDLRDTEGFCLMYGTKTELKKFGEVNVQKLARFIDDRKLSVNGAAVGIIEKVGYKSRQIYQLNMGDRTAKLTFSDQKLAEKIIKDATTVVGEIDYSQDGTIRAVNNVYEILPLTTIKFHRMISSIGDILLKVPIDVNVVFKENEWVLSNKDLGIISSNSSWDLAISGFHDYFIFLWTEYHKKDDSLLNEEEKEVKDYIDTLVV